jgi:adenosylcobyric acid synthase
VGALLVTGTSSDAGKSMFVAGLCRWLAREGARVAPFKAQNMSLNSFVTRSGAEIGRAQAAQAQACLIEPEAVMNPVLLKPGSDTGSQLIVLGRAVGEHDANRYWGGVQAALLDVVIDAYRDLASRFDVVICEGAGSPAEINLRQSDIVNMGFARAAGVPAIVVGDIDRGGVFASLVGTLALLDPADQALIAGFVVNKFRGDPALLSPGLRSLERLTGRRVYGVLPWDPGLWLDSEDALDLEGRRSSGAAYRVAVVRLPRISNFTDADALGLEPDLDLVFASGPRDVADADLIVLPGTRSTIGDLAWLRSRGLDRAIADHARRGRPLLGICGGFQMLGTVIADPHGVEAAAGTEVEGLGLLDVRTDFTVGKTLRLPSGTALSVPASGYEIHHGRVTVADGTEEFLGGARAGNVFGTMWHGSLEGDELRGAFLAAALGREPSRVSFSAARERRFDLLGELVERHLDVDALLDLARTGTPAGLPLLPPAGEDKAPPRCGHR